jgi:ParB family chromosome partitioning protein
VREKIAEGALSFGQAKCLLSLDSPQDQTRLAKLVIEKSLSVRELERMIKKIRSGPFKKRLERAALEEDWVKEMIQRYKTRIKLKRKKKGGSLEIFFHSEEELIRLVDLMMPR